MGARLFTSYTEKPVHVRFMLSSVLIDHLPFTQKKPLNLPKEFARVQPDPNQ